MPNASRKTEPWKNGASVQWIPAEGWNYPSGMVWCPMKMSGMAILKCAELQKEHGCGSLREFANMARSNPESALLRWPWLRRHRECPERAPEKEVRELRLVLTPLKLVEKSRKNPHAYRCPACGGEKAFSARRCRRCYRSAAKHR